MERLEIDNFIVIKKAHFDVKRINVLIGDNGSGKSLIGDLLYSFQMYLYIADRPKLYAACIKERMIDTYEHGLWRDDTRIKYSNGSFSVTIKPQESSVIEVEVQGAINGVVQTPDSFYPKEQGFEEALSEAHKDVFYHIEHPETGLFPTAQKKVVEKIAEFYNEGGSVLLTTHSPYILVALNNLIMAGNVARENPEKADEVHKIIPKDLWVYFSDVGAFTIENGCLALIAHPETRLIDGKKIDSVSRDMQKDFYNLQEIKIAHG